MLMFSPVTSIASHWDEAEALTRQHHQEVGALPADEFDLDRARYEQLEKLGAFKAFFARTEDGKLVGYAGHTLSWHLQFKRTYWAMQDALFVLPAHRGWGSMRFLVYLDKELAALGVHYSYRHVFAGRDTYSRALIRMGYREAERGFIRKLVA